METRKHYIIFGASSGIGQKIVKSLKNEGAQLTVTFHTKPHLIQPMLNGEDKMICLDFTNKKSMQEAMAEFEQVTYDGAVFCNGINISGPLISLSENDIESQTVINLLSPMLLTKAILKKMIQHKKGSIIFMGSVSAHRMTRGHSIYSASKAGLEGFTKALASEVAKRGIRVNTILPGPVLTPMLNKSIEETGDDPAQRIPMGRLIDSADISDLALFLLSERANKITGTVIPVDGGYLLW